MSLATFVQLTRPKAVRGSDRQFSDDDLIDTLRHLATDATLENKAQIVSAIEEILSETASWQVRNAAALALTDMVGVQATESIASVLRRPELARSAGTLLFALNDVGASLPLGLILDLVEQGSLETQAEAIAFLEDGRLEPASVEDLDEVRARLRAIQASPGAESSKEAAKAALEYFDAAPIGPELSM